MDKPEIKRRIKRAVRVLDLVLADLERVFADNPSDQKVQLLNDLADCLSILENTSNRTDSQDRWSPYTCPTMLPPATRFPAEDANPTPDERNDIHRGALTEAIPASSPTRPVVDLSQYQSNVHIEYHSNTFRYDTIAGNLRVNVGEYLLTNWRPDAYIRMPEQYFDLVITSVFTFTIVDGNYIQAASVEPITDRVLRDIYTADIETDDIHRDDSPF